METEHVKPEVQKEYVNNYLDHVEIIENFEAEQRKPLPAMDKQTKHDLEVILRDGYIIISDVLPPSVVSDLRSIIHSIPTPFGRNNFEGTKTVRIQALPAKHEIFDYIATHPRVINLMDRLLLPNYLLHTYSTIELHPGETSQPWHTDASQFRIPRDPSLNAIPHTHISANSMFAIDDFTEENGGTRIFPGSHLWPQGRLPDLEKDRWVACDMKAGGLMVWVGGLWHAGGANRSAGKRLGVLAHYCQPHLRPQENYALSIDPSEISKMSPRMRSLVGFSVAAPQFGHVDGVHPLRYITKHMDGGRLQYQKREKWERKGELIGDAKI